MKILYEWRAKLVSFDGSLLIVRMRDPTSSTLICHPINAGYGKPLRDALAEHVGEPQLRTGYERTASLTHPVRHSLEKRRQFQRAKADCI